MINVAHIEHPSNNTDLKLPKGREAAMAVIRVRNLVPDVKDKIICATVAHPDEDTIELTVLRPSSQSMTIMRSDVPFVLHALNLIETTQ